MTNQLFYYSISAIYVREIDQILKFSHSEWRILTNANIIKYRKLNGVPRIRDYFAISFSIVKSQVRVEVDSSHRLLSYTLLSCHR